MIESEAELVRRCIVEAGYRLIDTAHMYAIEKTVGNGIAKAIANGAVNRSDLFVVTKVWPDMLHDVEASLSYSLKLLGLDYVDLTLIHFPITQVKQGSKYPERVPMHKIWAQFEACQKKGMTRHIGVSNFNVQLLLDIFTYAETMPYCNQVEHHPFYQ